MWPDYLAGWYHFWDAFTLPLGSVLGFFSALFVFDVAYTVLHTLVTRIVVPSLPSLRAEQGRPPPTGG